MYNTYMTPNRLQDLESIRSMLSAVAMDLTIINNEETHRELSIALKHTSEAIKAMNFFLRDKPLEETEYSSASEIKAFFEELNSVGSLPDTSEKPESD